MDGMYLLGAGYDDLVSGEELLGRRQRHAMRHAGRHIAPHHVAPPHNPNLAARALPPGVPQGSVYLGDRSASTGIVSVAANAVASIPLTPQQSFTPKKFIYTGPAASFAIVDVLIGQMSMYANTNEQMADQWGVSAFNSPKINWKTLQVNQPATISVHNLTGGALNFSATVEGDAYAVP